MSDVSKINQESVATKLYDEIVNKKLWFLSKTMKEEWAVKTLTKNCSKIMIDFEKAVSDQNDYIVEIADINESMNNISNEYNERIEKLEKEIKELKQKEANGTITEEESNRLFSLFDEISSLTGDCNGILKNKKDEFTNKNAGRSDHYKLLEYIATDFGKTTVEKGTPLANDKNEIGEKAVKTGNELLDKVAEGKAVELKINTRLKK